VEVGVGHISEETSNDRGAKGRHKSDNAKGKPMIVHSTDEQQRTTKLERIIKLAEEKKTLVFNNVGHAIDLDLLRECYQRLDGKKAVGIDRVSKSEYGAKLEENLMSPRL